jgi:hypothetical protein
MEVTADRMAAVVALACTTSYRASEKAPQTLSCGSRPSAGTVTRPAALPKVDGSLPVPRCTKLDSPARKVLHRIKGPYNFGQINRCRAIAYADHLKWLRRQGRACILQKIALGNYSGVDLRGVNLRGANLLGAQFRGADLCRADIG